MKMFICLLYFLAITLSCAWAKAEESHPGPSEYSMTNIWHPRDENDEFSAWQQCSSQECVLSHLRNAGADQEVIEFVKALNGEGYLDSFSEKGKVDVGEVTFPKRANTNSAYILLNGMPSIVSTELSEPLDLSKNPNYSKIKRDFPNVTLWGASASLQSSKVRPNGGQRFIFSYNLLNGCHACEIAGSADIGFDFDAQGRFKGVSLLKITPAANDSAALVGASPSFDCGKARTGVEHMICANQDLAEADVKMAGAYQRALTQAGDRVKLTADQNAWRKNVRDRCSDVSCLREAYKIRIERLSSH
ncbi:MAG: lysozyme inhibitor LprI family protein [Methylococcus sp.]|nr:lysozyme inhibitor LprI family protein [Methylococcus sp.]